MKYVKIYKIVIIKCAPLSVSFKWRALPPRRRKSTLLKIIVYSQFLFSYFLLISYDIKILYALTSYEAPSICFHTGCLFALTRQKPLELHGREKWIINMAQNAFISGMQDRLSIRNELTRLNLKTSDICLQFLKRFSSDLWDLWTLWCVQSVEKLLLLSVFVLHPELRIINRTETIHIFISGMVSYEDSLWHKR